MAEKTIPKDIENKLRKRFKRKIKLARFLMWWDY